MESISGKPITNKEFFQRGANEVAKDLIGKLLCVKTDAKPIRMRITVTEAYEENDSACYGIDYKDGKYITQAPTPATAPLFEAGGVWCIYGDMLLLSCGQKGVPENVLIREAGNDEYYYGGPTILYEYLKRLNTIDHHGTSAIDTNNGIWLEDDGAVRDCCAEPRINLGKGILESDRDRKNRFISL